MQKTFTITGMDCESCAAIMKDIAKEIPGIKSVSVDYKTGKTELEYESEEDFEAFQKEVDSVGHYQVKL